MVTREELRGQWNQVKGRLRDHWGELSDRDLSRAQGSAEELIGVVQQKTGATRREVEEFLHHILDEGSHMSERAADALQHFAGATQEYADEASDAMRRGANQAAHWSEDYGKRVAETVRSRPTESIAIAFGLGIAAGALFFLNRRR